MKNYYFHLFFLGLPFFMIPQVGINTPSPSATLDIVSKGNNSTTKALKINNSGALEMVTVLDNGRIGIGTSTPNTSSILDITSTSAGILMPRMTSVQMNATATPAAGLQVYNTNENCTFLYNGSNWRSLCAKTFQQNAGGPIQVTIGNSVDLSQTISLAGTQNVTVHVSFNSNAINANAEGTYQILINGTSVAGSMRYSTQNAGDYL